MIAIRSFQRPGRLIARRVKGLRSRAVILQPGQAMAWHSTGRREELLLVLQGRLQLEVASAAGGRVSHRMLAAGRSAFLGKRTTHRVLNPSRHTVRYVYVTGS